MSNERTPQIEIIPYDLTELQTLMVACKYLQLVVPMI
jgi:hypothetical protein